MTKEQRAAFARRAWEELQVLVEVGPGGLIRFGGPIYVEVLRDVVDLWDEIKEAEGGDSDS